MEENKIQVLIKMLEAALNGSELDFELFEAILDDLKS
jgi:hypothetical protein